MRSCVSVLIFALVFLCFHCQESNGAQVDVDKAKVGNVKSKPWLQSSSFMAFKTKFKKSFKDDDEAAKRFAIFKENYDQIVEHNKKNTSYTQRIYDYHDRTLDEIRSTKLGLKFPNEVLKAVRQAYLQNQNKKLRASVKYNYLSKVDSSNVLPPIKDQMQCGSCWAFSMTAAMEGCLNRKYPNARTKITLSEQQLLDCSNAGSCRGGWPSDACKYYALSNKLNIQSDYPYTATDGKCKSRNFGRTFRITGCPPDDDRIGTRYVGGNEEKLKELVSTYGVVSVAIDSYCIFRYGLGVVSGTIADKTCTDMDHAVTVEGYNGAEWIVRNSWGPGWGEKGKFRVKIGKNECNIACIASAATC